MSLSMRHLINGDLCPPLAPNRLRIYSTAFCPFCHRAKLLFEVKGLDYETINLNWARKPDWYKFNTIPVIQINDKILRGSVIVSEFIDREYQDSQILPKDNYAAAKEKLIVEDFSQLPTKFYMFCKNKTSESEKDLLDAFDAVQKSLDGEYFSGSQAGFADFMLWPWFERIEMPIKYMDLKLDQVRFGKMLDYIQRMKQLDVVKKLALPSKAYYDYFQKMSLNGSEIDYDGIIQDALENKD